MGRGRPKKISVLDKIIALAEKPEEGAPPKKRKPAHYRLMTTGQKRAVREGNARRAAASKRSRIARENSYPRAPGVCGFRGVRWPVGERAIDRIMLAMDPGHWHAGGDLLRAAGLDRRQVANYMRILTQRRLVVRGINGGRSDYREPKWVYRLTALGLETRRYLGVLGYAGA